MAQPPKDVFGLLGTTLERKFRVERVVAHGGFGIVYQATHTGLDRRIALKVLRTPPELNDQARLIFIDTFRHEARAIAKLNHPSIVQVLDFGAADMPSGGQAPYMALEWLEGRTLHEELAERRNRGGRPVPEALAMLRPVLEALAYAHEEGIAHRDIKPANIMVVPTRRGPVLKLLDFGIAKAMEGNEDAGSGVTRTDSSLKAFSMAYAAPEQIGGARTGPWTDVHAMALIITEVLTDQPPYDGRDRTEVVCDILSPVRPTPAKRHCNAGPWEQVLAKALSLRPADRFASAGELLAALESVLPASELPAPTGRFAAIAATQTRPSGSLFGVPTIPPGMVFQPPAPVPQAPVPPSGGGSAPLPQPGGTGPNGGWQPGLAPPPSPPAVDVPPTTLRGVETSSSVAAGGARRGASVSVVVGAAAVATLLVVAVAVPIAVMKLRTHPAAAAPPTVVVAPPPVVPTPPVQPATVVTPPQPPALPQAPIAQQQQQQQPPAQPTNGANTAAGTTTTTTTAQPSGTTATGTNGGESGGATNGATSGANGEGRGRGRGRGRGGRTPRGGNGNALIEVD